MKQFTQNQIEWMSTPWGWAESALGFHGRNALYPQQVEVLKSVEPHGSKTIFRCGNEVGKTSVVATSLILWHLFVFPRGKVISTAGAWRQITGQLMPALKRHEARFPHWSFNRHTITINGVDRYEGFSTLNQSRSQGYHGTVEEPLLAIIDEAGSVPDAVFMSIEERCNPSRLLILGSPLDPVGTFYDNCTKHARHYSQHRLGQPDCPHIAREAILRTIAKYDPNALDGIDPANPDFNLIRQRCHHPLTKSRVFADFAELVSGALISLQSVERLWENPPSFRPGDRHAFLDFAAGGDENVIGVRHGNRCWIEDAWREKDTMSAVGRFLIGLQRLRDTIGLKPSETEGDASGLGKPMIDALHQAGWPLIPVHNGSAPIYDQDYKNRASEAWGEGAKLIRDGQVSLPQDEDLKAQLVTRAMKRDSRGKFWIEPKEDLAKAIPGSRPPLPSPDRADAILFAMLPSPQFSSISLSNSQSLEPLEHLIEEPELSTPTGYSAGW